MFWFVVGGGFLVVSAVAILVGVRKGKPSLEELARPAVHATPERLAEAVEDGNHVPGGGNV